MKKETFEMMFIQSLCKIYSQVCGYEFLYFIDLLLKNNVFFYFHIYFLKASERLLETHGIQTTDTLFLSNAPAGIVKIRFKENEERGQTYQGAKVCRLFYNLKEV